MGLIDFPTLNEAKRYVEETVAGAGALKGTGIANITVNDNNHLIVTFDKPLPDGTTQQDVGALPTSNSYVAEITTPSQVWTVQHNLNTPYNELTIIAVDTNGDFVIGGIDTDNSTLNVLVIEFDKNIAGKIVLKK